MRASLLVFSIMVITGVVPVSAKSYILNGGQKSKIKYRIVQLVEPAPTDIKNVKLTFVQPQSFSSPTYNQKIVQRSMEFSVPPAKVDSSRDKQGNSLITYTWLRPKESYTVEMSVIAENAVLLKKVKSTASFPLKKIPAKARPYLAATAMVPAQNKKIQALAGKLVQGAKTEFDAVQKRLDTNRNKSPIRFRNNTYYLSGVLFCNECGGTYRGKMVITNHLYNSSSF